MGNRGLKHSEGQPTVETQLGIEALEVLGDLSRPSKCNPFHSLNSSMRLPFSICDPMVGHDFHYTKFPRAGHSGLVHTGSCCPRGKAQDTPRTEEHMTFCREAALVPGRILEECHPWTPGRGAAKLYPSSFHKIHSRKET